VVILPSEVAADGVLLARELARFTPTIMQATPVTWRMLVETGWKGNKSLKVLCGGEAFPQELAAQLLPLCSSLWNLYGPTETTIWSAIFPVDKCQGLTPIGRPIANTQIYLLDSYLKPVPIGVAGELYIGGDGLARGYLNRPDLTAEKFIPNPFSDEPGARLYRSGDLGRYLPEGNIEFLGRVDHQVKVRGFRIELGEIESVLGRHSGVREAVVVAREDDEEKLKPADKRLVAYVVFRQEHPLTAHELRSFLKQKLPEYMVPSAFVFLERLPLTPNGKVDRRALPAPDGSRPELESGYVAPQTPVEEALTKIWEEVLKLERVGIHDNFFDLGGHSLVATQVMSRVRAALRVELPLRTLFERPTIAELSSVIVALKEEEQHATSLAGYA
jgi:acyl-CoA synthetase (AMP-forming)/AMP-acid ligase II/acyl carrier protein